MFTDLLWFVTGSSVITQPGRFKRAAHIQLFAPWPLWSRDVTVYGFAVDGLDEDDCLLVVSRSVRPSDAAVPADAVPPVGRRVVRADLIASGYELRPISPGVTRARFLFRANPKLAYIPMALINWASRMLCRWSLRAMESRARSIEGMPRSYQERLHTRPLYTWIESRLVESWTQRGVEYVADVSHATQPRRVSEDFDVNATPQVPSRSLIASMLRGPSQREREREDNRR